MGDETRKANRRRVKDALFRRVFRGAGIDIGCGGDPVDRDGVFPEIESCEGFDLGDGDAQDMLRHRSPNSYDFVYASHCLEHMRDPRSALRSWFALVRPSGFLVIVVPDEDLYEQGNWPSRFNPDHKWTFTIYKPCSWSPRSVNLVDLMAEALSGFSFVRLALLDDHYDYTLTGVDQSAGDAEAGIEVVLQKHDAATASPYGRIDLDRLLATGEVRGNPANLAHRLPTTRRCAELLLQRGCRTLVECGSQTTTLLHSQGISTAIWAAVAWRCGGRLWTVDRSAQAIQECRWLTSGYANIEYVISDSVEFLRHFDRDIDFLYLDSADFYEHCKDEARRHQRAEIEAAFPRLSRGALVLLDDANVQMWFARRLDDFDVQGSTGLTHEYLLEHGARCICDVPSYQRLYVIAG